MQELFVFAAAVILISMSGVMSPGPLFVSNILYGIKHGFVSGLKIALGHTIVELPLVILIGISTISLEDIPQFRLVIGVIGAVGLFIFAGLQIKNSILKKDVVPSSPSHATAATTATDTKAVSEEEGKTTIPKSCEPKHSQILTGVILSALNPFFIIWWFTIGTKLISDSIQIWSFYGIFIMFALHIWMDFVWLGTTAFLASKSSRWLSDKSYRIIGGIASIVLVYFGIVFLVDGINYHY